jgi:hypothetical protein
MKRPIGEGKRDEAKTTSNGGQERPSHTPSRGAQHHSSSSRTWTGGAGFGQANTQNRLSSSSRKRTHGEYVDQDSEVLPDAPAAHRQEIDESMPPPQILHQQYKEKHGHRLYFSQSPPQYLPNDHRDEVQPVIRSGHEAQVYADNRWTTQPIDRAQQHRSDSRVGNQYGMSGALHAIRGEMQQPENNHQNMAQLNRGRLDQPQPPQSPEIPFLRPIRQPNFVDRQHAPAESGHGRRTALANMDRRYVAHQATDFRQPLRTISRASTMRQPLMIPPASRASKYPTDSFYFSNSDLRPLLRPSDDYSFFNPTTPTPLRHLRDPIPIVPIERESPFFRRDSSFGVHPTTLRPSEMQLQPEQLVPGARHFHMQPTSPMEVGQKGRSLNALSFMNSPFTNMNKPIYDRDALSHTYKNGPDEFQYSTRFNQPYFQRPQSSVHHTRQSSAVPSRRTFTRDDDMKLLGVIRGAKSGNAGGFPNVVPYSKNRGYFSSTGVVRR